MNICCIQCTYLELIWQLWLHLKYHCLHQNCLDFYCGGIYELKISIYSLLILWCSYSTMKIELFKKSYRNEEMLLTRNSVFTFCLPQPPTNHWQPWEDQSGSGMELQPAIKYIVLDIPGVNPRNTRTIREFGASENYEDSHPVGPPPLLESGTWSAAFAISFTLIPQRYYLWIILISKRTASALCTHTKGRYNSHIQKPSSSALGITTEL